MTKKLNKKQKTNDIKPVSQEEFDKMVKILLNTPPRKRNKERKQFSFVYNSQKYYVYE